MGRVIPISSSESCVAVWSSRRSTSRSPYTVGIAENRISTLRLPMRTDVCPSWGECRLAMSSSVITFSREEIAGASDAGGENASTSMPSMRNRISSLVSCGCTCTSLARRRSASNRIMFTSRITGVCLASCSRSVDWPAAPAAEAIARSSSGISSMISVTRSWRCSYPRLMRFATAARGESTSHGHAQQVLDHLERRGLQGLRRRDRHPVPVGLQPRHQPPTRQVRGHHLIELRRGLVPLGLWHELQPRAPAQCL